MTKTMRASLGWAMIAAGMALAFIFYIDQLTPPSRPVDILVHVVFFPAVFPLAPVFLDSAYDMGWVAYLTYPVLALGLTFISGNAKPVSLAGLAIATAYLLPWLGAPLTVMGYQSGIALEAMIGSDILAAVAMGLVPVPAMIAMAVPGRRLGAWMVLIAGLVVLVCLAATISADAFLAGFGDMAIGGYLALVAALAAILAGGGRLGQSG